MSIPALQIRCGKMFLIYLIDLVSSMSSSGYDAGVIQWPEIYTHFWVPSFFPTSTNGNDQGDFDLAIIFAANISAKDLSIFCLLFSGFYS